MDTIDTYTDDSSEKHAQYLVLVATKWECLNTCALSARNIQALLRDYYDSDYACFGKVSNI